jgi:hypothetical protein
MRAEEQVALRANKAVLVLDTMTGGDAERLTPRISWRMCVVIPDYALLPNGGLCATTGFYKQLSLQ